MSASKKPAPLCLCALGKGQHLRLYKTKREGLRIQHMKCTHCGSRWKRIG